MSSTYRILCLSHDPALVLEAEWHSPVEAATVAADPSLNPTIAAHATCDLLVGRYSYPLIEVGCPEQRPEGDHTQHRDARWIDVAWLRLAWAATGFGDPTIHDALERLPGCWSPERLRRLREELGR